MGEIGALGGPGRQIRSHGRTQRRFPAWALVILVLGLIAVGAGLRFVPGSPFASGRGGPVTPTSLALPPLPLHFTAITAATVGTKGFLGWSLLDRRTNEIVGSADMDTTTDTASMIKAWLAADYLRRATESKQNPSTSRLSDLEIMIRDSDNDAADRIYTANGGSASIKRMVSVCSLTDSANDSDYFGDTLMSPRDTARLGQCIADGRAAGPQWTNWLLDMMRKVRGDGDFGIREAFPAAQQAQIAIKNGWLWHPETNEWHTNCLAIGDTWVLAVMQRYPTDESYETGFEHTASVCQKVATTLLNAPIPRA